MKILSAVVLLFSFSSVCCHSAAIDDLDGEKLGRASPVTVRVWNDGFHGGKAGSVGHTSIETSQHYISLWPSDNDKIKGKVGATGMFGAIADKANCRGTLISKALGVSLRSDLSYCEHSPDQVYQIRLDSDKIDSFWKSLCKNPKNRKVPDRFETPGVSDSKRKTVEFDDLWWYIGGDPKDHVPDGSSAEDLKILIEQRQQYSCASLVLHMLIVGEVFELSNINEKFISDIIPAYNQSWYKRVLEKPMEEEYKGPVPESWVGDLGRMVLRPVVEGLTSSCYVAPYQIGKLVQGCCIKQYRCIFPYELSFQIEKSLSSYYPERDLLRQFDAEKWEFLDNDESSNESDKQQQLDAMCSYISARGRTVEDIGQHLQSRSKKEKKSKTEGWCALM